MEYWDERGRKQQEAEEICIMSFVICTSCQLLMRFIVDACSVYWRQDSCRQRFVWKAQQKVIGAVMKVYY